jgi:hypothetical protein
LEEIKKALPQDSGSTVQGIFRKKEEALEEAEEFIFGYDLNGKEVEDLNDMIDELLTIYIDAE